VVAVSGGLIFLGYQLLVYGYSQVRGDNAGFFDLLWPGRYNGPNPDPPAQAATKTTPTTTGAPRPMPPVTTPGGHPVGH